MLSKFITDPSVPAVCVHNTNHWQVSELMGGLACEILRKTRDIDANEQKFSKLPLHDCYPSLFMQGDEASEFLEELRAAQARFSSGEIDRLVLSEYEATLLR